MASLRDTAPGTTPIVLNAVVGPRGDAYAPEDLQTADEAQAYHGRQLSWLAGTEVDMVTAMTFTQSDEAVGFVRAATALGLPSVVSFTVETDGALPTGQPLGEAVAHVDLLTDGAAAYFMVNCAHPDHLPAGLAHEGWAQRVKGLRCNASRMSHAELDAAEVLDPGDPDELAASYADLVAVMPWLTVLGGCCGTDLRHVTAIARSVTA